MKTFFENGYGVSVISHGYGGDVGLKELAVLHGGRICYDTPITDDVMGHLTGAEVLDIIEQVKQLPKKV
jgi:hypothetical protein